MIFLKDMLSPAAPGLSSLLPLLIVFVISVHIYIVSVLFTSGGLSLIFRKKDRELSDTISSLFFGKLHTVLSFTVAPLVILIPLYRLVLFEAAVHMEQYLLLLLVLLTAGLGAFYLYRKIGILLSGALGTLALLLYISLFSVLLSILLFPEKWPFLKELFPYPLFSVTPVFVTGLLVGISLINTGSSLGFIYLTWGERKLPDGSALIAPITRMRQWLVLAGTLFLPPVLFLFLFTLPAYSMGRSVFPAAVLILFFTVLSAWAVIPGKKGRGNHGFAFVSSLLLTLSFSVMLFNVQKYSNMDRLDMAKQAVEKRVAAIKAERMEIYSKAMKVSPEYGETIYKEQCTACHDFEKTVLGPSFNSVIPKYAENPEEMVQFILNPVKIDPNLPAMPDPGLTTLQARSVTAFILERDKQNKGEKSE